MNNLEQIKLKDIKPAPYNPRQITPQDLEKLNQSIKEYGLVDPILIHLKDNTIIGGHQRYKILKQQNQETGEYETLQLYKRGDIGWIFTNETLTIPTESHEKGLNLALNKISGEWDYLKLNNLIDELLDDANFNINLTGFDDLDLESLNKDLDDMELVEEDNNNYNKDTNNISMLITCRDETELNQLYERLTEEGYNIKIR